jgi:hypothetical protein
MRFAILDSNALRGIRDNRLSALIEAEKSAGVRRFADPWTLMELLAHLRSVDDPAYWPSRRGLRRCALRALQPRDGVPRVVAPSESQLARLLFGSVPREMDENLDALVEVARIVAEAEDADDLSSVHDRIEAVAQHVGEKEAWFAEYFEDLRLRVLAASDSTTAKEHNAVIRAFTRSEEGIRADAVALATRAFRQTGRQVPEPMPDNIIDRVVAASGPASCAAALLLEIILCDGANLDKFRIRNLLWDQEVASDVGQSIEGLPVILVTNDSFFGRAAALSGHNGVVCTLEKYLTDCGLPVA